MDQKKNRRYFSEYPVRSGLLSGALAEGTLGTGCESYAKNGNTGRTYGGVLMA